LEKCGFIGRILPAENFHEAVLKHATEAAQFSLGAIKTTKKLSRDVDREMLLKLNEEELDRLAERMISPESIESILNFVGKLTITTVISVSWNP
jgi:peroxisomal 3,2-trans-enoyl-CoA isomerase